MIRHLAIVIPTFNRKDSLERALNDLNLQQPVATRISIIVVVDGSTDGTTEMLSVSFPYVRLISGDGQWWWSRSVNEGCRAALTIAADGILLLNDDVRLPNDYLTNLLHASELEPDAIIGSLNLSVEKNPRIFFSGAHCYKWLSGSLCTYHDFLAPYCRQLTGLYPSIVLPGRGLLIPVEIFKLAGYFNDRRLPQYKADYDFVLRANEKNIKTLISWDAVLYNHLASTGDGSTFIRKKGFSFLFSLFKKNSRTNLIHNFWYYQRHFPRKLILLFPVTALMIIVRQFRRFFSARKKC